MLSRVVKMAVSYLPRHSSGIPPLRLLDGFDVDMIWAGHDMLVLPADKVGRISWIFCYQRQNWIICWTGQTEARHHQHHCQKDQNFLLKSPATPFEILESIDNTVTLQACSESVGVVTYHHVGE